MDYLNQLDHSQREAVLFDEGPSLVVAGAGSGKTRVLTYKIVHLLHTGYQPHEILALTFTNKAAREMQRRIASLVNEYNTHYLWMGTFHSVFYRILRREAKYTGYPVDFTIYDTEDSKNLIRTILKELNLDEKIYKPGLVLNRISNAKNSLVTSKAYLSNTKLMREDKYKNIPLIYEIYNMYQNRCVQSGVMDFDDLLLQSNILFHDHPEALAKYQNQFQYVLVYEYQDTNFSQHLLVSRLCEHHQRIFVVGDDAQSIYSFRGANLDNMLHFKDSYPDCKLFKLEQNYRSTQTIVDAANSLIAKNQEQIAKTVYSKNKIGSKIAVLSSYTDFEEGYLVSAKIVDMMQKQGCLCADFAILYRTNAQSRIFEEALRKRKISYRIYGGLSFYQRKEIKDALAYMRLIVNPKDEEALKRIINYPLRAIGQTTVDKLQNAALSAQVSLWEVICAPEEYQVDLNRGTASKIMLFKALIEEMQELNQAMDAAKMGEVVAEKSGIKVLFLTDESFDKINRIENLNELLKAMKEFVAISKEEGSTNISLSDFLMSVSLMTDQDNDKNEFADQVTLMTVHAAKGLEFKNVFVVGMEDELFPSPHAAFFPKAIEEERRLFYVAITRAAENCIITYSKNRYRNGENKSTTPSSFLNDIDSKYLDYSNYIELPANRWERKTPRYDDEPPGYIPQRSLQGRNPAWDSEVISKQAKRSVTPSRTLDDKKMSQCLIPLHSSTKKMDTSDAEQAKTVSSIASFTVGDKVLHDRFGKGIILSLEGNGNNAKATVEFNNTGVKVLILKYARLKPL